MSANVHPAGEQTGAPSRRRCVLWSRPDAAEAARLQARLQGRGAPVLTVEHGAQVMRELARGDVGVVIFCEPLPEPERGELIEALRRYYPAVVRWEQHVGADGQVRLVKVGSAGRGGATEGTTAAAATSAIPEERLPADGGRRTGHGTREMLPITPILTPEELEMLLGEPLTAGPKDDEDDDL